jgi:Ca2+-binding RTX toxin-like protein
MTATVTAITTTGVTAANSNLYRFLANIASTSGNQPGSFTGNDSIDGVKIKFVSATNDFVYSGGSIQSGTLTGLTIVFHGKTILTEIFSPGLDIAAVKAAADAFFASNYTDHSALDAIFDTIPYDFTGNKGADHFGGGSAADTVHGGGGNDVIVGTLGADILDGGAGINTLNYSKDTIGVSLFLGGVNLSVADSLAEGDVVTNFRNLIGGSGNDDIGGDNLANKIVGGAGDDSLEGEGGNDKLIGGIGSDTAAYDQALKAVKVNLAIKDAQKTGGAGKDTLVSIENLVGSHFNDTLTGNGSDNKLFGSLGNDLLKGGGGNDTLNGEADNDTLNGGAGNDILNGGAGTDLLQGSTGDDGLNGDADNDTLQGGAGNDTLQGGSEDDILEGGAGNDTLDGDTGNDTASYASAVAAVTVDLSNLAAQNTGGAGMDTLANIDNLIGSKFADTLTGDANDNVIEGGLGNDTLDGGTNGAGGDTVSYAHAKAAVTVNLAAGTATGGGGSDTLSGIEGALGSNFNDTLIAAATGSKLDGGAGNDIVVGGAGADTLDGGAGINTLSYANDTAGVHVNFFGGNNFGGDATGDSIVFGSFLNLLGGTGDDHLVGNGFNNRIDGGDGDDTVSGHLGNDTLIGGANGAFGDTLDFGINALTSGVTVNLSITTAQDTGAGIKTISGFENIAGSDFDDLLTGDAGVNSIGGGAGDDIIKGGAGADVLDGGANNAGGGDWVSYEGSSAGVTVNVSGVGSGGDAEGDLLFNFENIIGSAFADTLAGDGGDNTFEGGLGADAIDGGGDGPNGDTVAYLHSAAGVTVDLNLATQVSAGEANGDVLSNIENIVGSAFADTLTGDSGNNLLIGGLGADILTGGTGADIFLFESLAVGGDHIADFESGVDKLAVFGSGSANFDASGNPVAGDGNPWFLYDTDDGKLYFDADGNGAGAQVLLMTLDGAPTLLATDIVPI